MTKETKIAIGIGSALALGFLAVKVFSNKRSSIVSDAKKEYKHWGKGTIKEGDERTMQRLRDYWKSVGLGSWSDSKMVTTPWSASFISYIMEKNNVKGFEKSASHSVYIQKAKNNTSGIKAYRPYDVKIKEGDLVCYDRNNNGVDFDTSGRYESHCDIVVNVSKDKAEVIGGNLSSTVKVDAQRYVLENGKIKKDTATRYNLIAVLKI